MADYREEFQKLLESTYIPLDGDKDKIGTAINDFLNEIFPHIPDKLYRYRNCEDYNIESFRNGTIYVCKASRFTDKYDSRVFVDRERYLRTVKDYLKENLTKSGCVSSDKDFEDKIINESVLNFLKESEGFLTESGNRFRTDKVAAKLGCFTESVQSKFMWDYYAGGYTGFALEYNMKELWLNYLDHSKVYMFPVIYSDIMPDVTDDKANVYYEDKCQEEGWKKDGAPFSYFLIFNLIHSFTPYLYKDKEEYSHEREWRLIYNDGREEDYALIPDLDCLKAIYYGPDITPENKSILHDIAARRGIKEYDVAFDLESRNYKLKIQNRG